MDLDYLLHAALSLWCIERVRILKKSDDFWRSYAPFSTRKFSCGHFLVPKPCWISMIFCVLLYLDSVSNEFAYRRNPSIIGRVMPLFQVQNSVVDTFSNLNINGSLRSFACCFISMSDRSSTYIKEIWQFVAELCPFLT